MKTKFLHFAGIDVSKNKADVCLIVNKGRSELFYGSFDQSAGGFKALKKWLRDLTGNALGYLLVCVENTGLYDDGIGNTPVTISVTSFNGNVSNSFTFAKTWTAEISGWFNSNPSEGLLIARSMGAMNAALSKHLWKKKATVKVGVRDILRTANFRGYSRYADVDLDVFNDRRMDTRQINVSFSYKFGKNNIDPARRRNGGASEEQNRVKTGG